MQDVPGARTIRYPDRVALYASPQPLSCTLSTCATLLAAAPTVVGPVNNSLPGGQIHSSTSILQHSKLLESPLADKCTEGVRLHLESRNLAPTSLQGVERPDASSVHMQE